MFSDFFSFKKRETEEIPDVSNEALVILEGIPSEIKQILQKAQILEKKQLKEGDVRNRRDFCESALIEYQKAIDLVKEASKKHRKNKEFAQQDIYDAQDLRIVDRMEYLESVLKGIKEMKRREAA